MNNVDCKCVRDYTLSMLDATPGLDTVKRQAIAELVVKLCDQSKEDTRQTQSYRLGFLLVDEMGEDFLRRLFREPPPEYQIRPKAPVIDEPKPLEGVAARVGLAGLAFHRKLEKPAPLMVFAYGTSMSTKRLARRFNWTDNEAREVFSAENAARGARLYWDTTLPLTSARGRALTEGLPNLTEDPDGEVWGVLYALPTSVNAYLENDHPGYREINVTVCFSRESDGPTELARTYIAEQTARDLKPSHRTIEHMLTGAREHCIPSLAPDYFEQLDDFPTLAETPEEAEEPMAAAI